MRFKLDTARVLLLILGALVVLSLLGVNIRLNDLVIFYINSRPITLFNVAALAIVVWLIRVSPSPFKQIIMVVVLLWLLSLLGFFFFGWITNVLLLIIVLVVIFSIL
jgi:hypothetical protein